MKKVDTSYIEHEKYKDGTLTIGCIGQPNVGKSSLMNAIIGKKVTMKLAQGNWCDNCYDCKHWEDRFYLCIRLAPPLYKHPHIMLQSILSMAWGFRSCSYLVSILHNTTKYSIYSFQDVFISQCKILWAESRHQISPTTNYILSFQVVSVSRTPGHTKHFQTIYLTSNVRLCDCPGLVFPSRVPKTLQVHKYVCILKNDFKHQGLVKCNASFPSDGSFCMLWLARKIN